jgi:hypothetical protein
MRKQVLGCYLQISNLPCASADHCLLCRAAACCPPPSLLLQERGVNEDLGEYLRHLMYDKEQVRTAFRLKRRRCRAALNICCDPTIQPQRVRNRQTPHKFGVHWLAAAVAADDDDAWFVFKHNHHGQEHELC